MRELTPLEGVQDFAFLGIERDFRALIEGAGFANYQIEVTGEVVGDPDRDVEQGPLFPYPNERVTAVVVRAVK
jgi:hypothetical protein